MSRKKHLKARKDLGLFFIERRKEIGHSCKALADFIGISENTMERIEEGLFDYDIMLLFQICEALEIKPFFVPLELQKSFTDQIFGTNLN
jgi:DNA-binding XRE family transcriptional regulator